VTDPNDPKAEPSQAVPHVISAEDIPEDLLAQILAASQAPAPQPRSLRSKLFVPMLVAAIGLGASVMSCVGQSFSYRQAHALEGIEQQLKDIKANCTINKP
jgi:hypothetical protein